MNTTSSLQHFRRRTVAKNLAPVISISPIRVETTKVMKKKVDKKPVPKQSVKREGSATFFTEPVFRPKNHEFF